MPSISSKIVSLLSERMLESTFGNLDQDLHKIRAKFQRLDNLMPAPAGVDITSETLTNCEADWVRPRRNTDRVVLYFPGGAWALRSRKGHRRIAAQIAQEANANVYLLFYRLAPEHVYPAALNDCVEAYQRLLDNGINTDRITIGGDSAGGNLCLGTLLTLRDRGCPLPAGAFALSPCTDLSRAKDDPVGGDATRINSDPRFIYVGGDEALFYDPYASPLHAELNGLCPLLLQVSSTEGLLQDSIQFVDRAREAGVQAEVEVWQGQPHVWHGMGLPESKLAFAHLGDYIRMCCP